MRLIQNIGAFGLGFFKMAQQHIGVGHVKIPTREFFFGLLEHIAIAERNR